MRTTMRQTLIVLALALAVSPLIAGQTTGTATGDRAAVHQAALDYVDAIYKSDVTLIERSVHPQLTKRGFWRDDPSKPWGPQTTMTYEQLLNVAKTWNAKKDRDLSIKKIEVLDVLDQTAVAKITANWGIDYMQLAKYDGQWKIINIVWQAHPAK